MISREEFELAFPVPSNIRWSDEHQSYGFIRRKGNDISQVHRYRSMWNAWQASRQALVVELPAKISHLPHSQVGDGIVLPEAEQYDEAIDDCREAIEAAGVRVKP